MNPELTVPRLLRESVPAALVVLLWTLLGAPLPGVLSDGARAAGAVMALLYVVVRGVALANELTFGPAPEEPVDVLTENATVAVGAAAWFLLGGAAYLLEAIWRLLGVPGAFTGPTRGLAFVCAATGVATVLLYAVAVGVPRVREAHEGGTRSRPGTDAAAADD